MSAIVKVNFDLKSAIVVGTTLTGLAVLTDFLYDKERAIIDGSENNNTLQVYGYRFLKYGSIVAGLIVSSYYFTNVLNDLVTTSSTD